MGQFQPPIGTQSTGEPADSPVHWLNRPKAATALDLVCLGWSAPPSAVTQFDPARAVVVIANPTHTEWVDDIIKIANNYDNCQITAWSLGVVTASRLLGDISNGYWVALNGVVDPFNGCLSRTTSEAMATNLSPAALTTFQMGMCGSKSALRTWQALPGHPDLTTAQAALAWWINLADQPTQVPIDRWNQAIIGTHDRIMSPKAQLTQWQAHPNTRIETRPAAHWMPDYLLNK